MAASPRLSVRTLHRYARAMFEYSWPNPSAVCSKALINSSKGKVNPNTELLSVKHKNPKERNGEKSETCLFRKLRTGELRRS